MNRAVLSDLQRRSCYPSVTVLFNTTPDSMLSPAELTTAQGLIDRAQQRLTGDASEALTELLVSRLGSLLEEAGSALSSRAVGLFASADHAAVVRLGRGVEERVVIDETFATRDLVADLNRTARYRVFTVSEQKTRLLIGDRSRLVEERTDTWPMLRGGQSASSWIRDVGAQLLAQHAQQPLPTVIAGVDRTVRRAVVPELFETIGFIPGNHDRTGWAALHNLVWPLVTDWLRADGARAIDALNRARSACRFAGGIDEIWPLANEGRVDILVVEDRYAVAARIINGNLERSEDREAADVIDDIVDEAIEAVLRYDGKVVIVPDDELAAHGHIAAVLRF
jgi:Bacterial archaeo-eukaryotic release factor family 3